MDQEKEIKNIVLVITKTGGQVRAHLKDYFINPIYIFCIYKRSVIPSLVSCLVPFRQSGELRAISEPRRKREYQPVCQVCDMVEIKWDIFDAIT